MIRVIIERQIANGVEANYLRTARKVLMRCIDQPGYISGESMIDANNPNHRFTLTKWESVARWTAWVESNDRKGLMEEMQMTLTEPEKITVLKNNI